MEWLAWPLPGEGDGELEFVDVDVGVGGVVVITLFSISSSVGDVAKMLPSTEMNTFIEAISMKGIKWHAVTKL